MNQAEIIQFEEAKLRILSKRLEMAQPHFPRFSWGMSGGVDEEDDTFTTKSRIKTIEGNQNEKPESK